MYSWPHYSSTCLNLFLQKQQSWCFVGIYRIKGKPSRVRILEAPCSLIGLMVFLQHPAPGPLPMLPWHWKDAPVPGQTGSWVLSCTLNKTVFTLVWLQSSWENWSYFFQCWQINLKGFASVVSFFVGLGWGGVAFLFFVCLFCWC